MDPRRFSLLLLTKHSGIANKLPSEWIGVTGHLWVSHYHGLNGYTAVAANKDGRLEVFCTGIDGALWHIWQIAPNGNWSAWTSLGKPTGVDLVLNINVHQNSDGRLEVFMAGSDNALWNIWQIAPNGNWSTWGFSGNATWIRTLLAIL